MAEFVEDPEWIERTTEGGLEFPLEYSLVFNAEVIRDAEWLDIESVIFIEW